MNWKSYNVLLIENLANKLKALINHLPKDLMFCKQWL